MRELSQRKAFWVSKRIRNVRYFYAIEMSGVRPSILGLVA
jgi:hypothetical protein